MRLSKFAQNSPENDVHVKQVSNPSFLGIVGDKKWSPVLDLGIRSPIFCTQNYWKWLVLGEKNGTWDAQIKNRRPLFVATYPQKCWNRLLSHENHFQASVGQILKSRILGSFLAHFQCKIPK